MLMHNSQDSSRQENQNIRFESQTFKIKDVTINRANVRTNLLPGKIKIKLFELQAMC